MSDLRKNSFKRGAYIFVEGDEDVDDIYLIESGEVELKSVYEKIHPYRSIAGEGEIIGFISSLCNRPRLQSAIARRDTEILTFKKPKFIELVQKNRDIAFKIIRTFANELRAYDDMMLSLSGDPDILSDDVRLFTIGMYYYRIENHAHASYVLNRYLQLYPASENGETARKVLSEIKNSGRQDSSGHIQEGVYRVYSDKQMIFCEHEPGDDLFIIKEGKVKIVKVRDETEIMLSVLKTGDIFGELAIVSDKPRNASAISWGKTTLLPINKDTLKVILPRSPNIIHTIFMAISQRIWFTSIQLESKLYKKPITRLYASVENRLREERISLKSTKPVSLNFGIDELLKMTGITPATAADAIDSLLKDPNLNFNFGQITVEAPCNLSAKAKYYRSRDHLGIAEEEGKTEATEYTPPAPEEMETAPSPQAEERILGLDIDDLRIPSDDIPIDLD